LETCARNDRSSPAGCANWSKRLSAQLAHLLFSSGVPSPRMAISAVRAEAELPSAGPQIASGGIVSR
jgi:hypothetical protein